MVHASPHVAAMALSCGLLSGGLLSCGSSKSIDTASAVHDPCLPTWDGWTDGFIATWCRSCHSASTPDRRGAPEGTNLDTEADALALADRIRARVLEERTMPVGGGVPQAELDLLEDWLTCASSSR